MSSHGTNSNYSLGCRCVPCRAAHTVYARTHYRYHYQSKSQRRGRCEYFNCEQTFLGKLPDGWSEYGTTRFMGGRSSDPVTRSILRNSTLALATWCPEHSYNTCALETDFMTQNAAHYIAARYGGTLAHNIISKALKEVEGAMTDAEEKLENTMRKIINEGAKDMSPAELRESERKFNRHLTRQGRADDDAGESGKEIEFVRTDSGDGCRAVSRGEALRNMEVMPVNHNVRNQRPAERSDHQPGTIERSSGKPLTVNDGDSEQLRRGPMQVRSHNPSAQPAAGTTPQAERLGNCESLHGDVPHVHITVGLNPCVNWRRVGSEIVAEMLILPCGCNADSDDPKGPIFWNPFNKAVQCHKCGHAYELARAVAPVETPLQETNFKQRTIDCAKELREHYNSDWDSTVPGAEFDAEIIRILHRHFDRIPIKAPVHTRLTAEQLATEILANHDDNYLGPNPKAADRKIKTLAAKIEAFRDKSEAAVREAFERDSKAFTELWAKLDEALG